MRLTASYLATLVATATVALLGASPASAAPALSDIHQSPTSMTLSKRAQAKPRFAYNKKVRGVNLGGWFVVEPWMQPNLFAPYKAAGAVDQWTLMQALGSNALAYMKQHWSTWIVEDDFRQMAAAGLNTVRIPIGHWSLNGSSTEPYLAYAEQPYISQAILWAAKYKLDVLLDLHTAPGSVNGYDNGGRQGPINFANVNGTDNANRLVSALVSMVKLWVNPSKYGGIVKGIEVVNEPILYGPNITQAQMTAVYDRAYTAIRNAVSATAITLPTTVFHDGFLQPLSNKWNAYAATKKTGSFAFDTHRYQAWEPQKSLSYEGHISFTCGLKSELSAFHSKYPTVVGEWSLAYGCTTCSYSNISDSIASQNNRTQNLYMRRFWEAQTRIYEAAAGGWIFWSWRTDTFAEWSYKDSRAQGWIPSSAATRVFQIDANGCPTTNLRAGVTLKFATENNATTAVPPSTVSPSPSPTASPTPSPNAAKLAGGASVAPTPSASPAAATVSPVASPVASPSPSSNPVAARAYKAPSKAKKLTRQEVESLVASSNGPIAVTFAATNQTINVNVFPFLKGTTFANGPSH